MIRRWLPFIAGAGIVIWVTALVMLAQGELARQEVEASGGHDFTTAQGLLREEARRLEALDKLLAQQIAQAAKAAPPALTADELFALQNNTRFQHARARRGDLERRLVALERDQRCVRGDRFSDARDQLDHLDLLEVPDVGDANLDDGHGWLPTAAGCGCPRRAWSGG